MQFDNVKQIDTAARWIDFPVGKTIAKFLMVYTDYRGAAYLKIKNKHSRPYRKLIEVEALPPDRDREIAIASFVEATLRGWEGITAGGQPVPYTAEAARDFLMQSPPSVFYGLLTEAADEGNYSLGDDDVKN